VNNHDGRQITVSIEGDNNAPIIIDSVIAKVISDNAAAEYALLGKEENVDLSETDVNKENVVFRLTQIKNDEDPTKNTKGIIEEVDGKEHHILFSKTETKEFILNESNNPFKKNYLVNIKVNLSNAKIKSYTILDLNDSYIDEEPDLFS
jgi:hypothetical protein